MVDLALATVNSTRSATVPTVSKSDKPVVFTDIYQDLYNMVIWQRSLPPKLISAADDLLKSNNSLQVEKEVTPENVFHKMRDTLQDLEGFNDLSEDISKLVDMFCCLFDLTQVGLRLTTLDQAMCPRFHVDKVPCRLITTYLGSGTQWLPHQAVDRSKLGTGNKGLADELSGLYKHSTDIQQLAGGYVALMKGELWDGKENAGLVHRSPALKLGERRLLLTLDFLS